MDLTTISSRKGIALKNQQGPSRFLTTSTEGRSGHTALIPSVVTKTLRVMQLTAALLLIFSLGVCAKSSSQTITFSGTNVSYQKIFGTIEKQTGYSVVVNKTRFDKSEKISITAEKMGLLDFMELILQNKPYQFEIKSKTIFIKTSSISTDDLNHRLDEPHFSAALPPITGIIRDAEGNPLAGVNVVIKGTKKGVTTDAAGKFSIDANINDVLIISSVGYGMKEIKVPNLNDALIVVLNKGISELDEVQYIAYGTTSKRLNTGNIATVKAEEISKQPISNPLQAIQGRVPGIYISQSTGAPGGNYQLRIQGENSINKGNEAFYVIDGIPYSPQNLYSGVSGGAIPGTGSTLNFINPADIESIEILKDADATAIYGSRAANGAILITTKKGKVGKTKVDINLQSGIGQVARTLKLLNTQEYIEIRKEAFTNSSQTPGATDYDINGTWDQNRYTNWQDKLIGGTAHYDNLRTSISGGNANTQFLASVGYLKETTVFPGNFSDTKGNVHFTINHTSTNKQFEFSISSNYLQDLNKLPTTDLTIYAITLSPNAPELYNSDGTINWAPKPNNPNSVTFNGNPAALLLRKYTGKTNNILQNASIGYKIFPGLTLKSTFGYNRLQTEEINTTPQASFVPTNTRNNRKAIYGDKYIDSWIIEPQLTYSKKLNIGDVEGLIGGSFQSVKNSVMAFDGTNYANDSQLENSLAAGNITPDVSTMQSQYRYNAIFARINYRLKDKYILNLTARRDGSSRFGSENLFHSFYSIAGAWIFSNELWMKENLPIISFGKIRATYGTTGNDQIRDYQFLNLFTNYTANVSIPYQQSVGILPTGHANPYLQWEETKKLNFGLDLGFYNNKILLNANYYINRSSNQLLDYPLPYMTGFQSVQRNVPALVQNYGWEFQLDITPLKNKVFSWNPSINLTIPKNKLIAYPGIDESSYTENFALGKPVNSLRVFEFAGVDKNTGLYTFHTNDGKITSTPDYSVDKTKRISLGQKFYGGINNSINYKSIELSFLFQFVKQTAVNYRFGTLLPGLNKNQPREILKRWTKENDQTAIQKVSTSPEDYDPFFAVSESDASYSDASFVRLKSAALYYSFPSKWVNKIKLSQSRIFIQGQNLWTITNFKGGDPETISPQILPPLRIVSAGIQLTF